MRRGHAGKILASCLAPILMGAVLALPGCSHKAPAGEPLLVVHSFGESGDAPGQFGYPRCITSSALGKDLWIIDKLARVQRINAATGDCLEDWHTPKFDKGKPTGVSAWSPSRVGTGSHPPMLIIADTHEHRVLCYAIRPKDASRKGPRLDPPELLTQFGTFGEGDGHFIYTTDVAILPNADGTKIARLYVGEYGGHDRVHIWEPDDSGGSSPTFRFVRTFGVQGPSGAGPSPQFNRPHSLDIDATTRRLVISDACNHRVGVFSLEGELLSWFGKRAAAHVLEGHVAGTAPGEFTYPYGIETLDDGTVLVSEFGNNRLQRIDLTTGASLGIFGQPGRSKGQLSTPWAIAASGDTIYVLDSGNSRVQAFEKPTGKPRGLTSSASTTGIVAQGGAR